MAILIVLRASEKVFYEAYICPLICRIKAMKRSSEGYSWRRDTIWRRLFKSIQKRLVLQSGVISNWGQQYSATELKHIWKSKTIAMPWMTLKRQKHLITQMSRWAWWDQKVDSRIGQNLCPAECKGALTLLLEYDWWSQIHISVIWRHRIDTWQSE